MLRLSNIILEMIAKGADVKATLDRLCVEVAERAPGAICAVFEVDEEGLLRLLSAPELPEPYRTAIDGLPYESDVGSIGSAACLPRPLPSIDVAGEPHCAALSGVSLPPGLNACWSTPIIGEAGRTTGALALFCREPCTQTEDVRTIGQECAHLCAIALERHERFLEHERLANIDLLTGLGNRLAFGTALSQLPLHRPGSWALLILDLDNLKVVNDGFGHHAGDLLIQAAASRAEKSALPNRVYRMGGDEFAVIVEAAEALQDLEGFAERILRHVRQPLICNGHTIVPKTTIGGAIVGSADRSADAVRRNADFALYHAKETGRGGFVRYWPGIDTRITHRITAIRDVDAALREGRVETHYQPIVRLDTREIVAMEALCRLRMANGGLLAAASFQEATADIHVASELTRRMLEIVARDMHYWNEESVPIEHIGINVSLSDFHGGQLEQQISSAVTDLGLHLEQLVIEVSESDYPALRDKAALDAIEGLRLKGLRIALDDFGTGGGLLMPLLTMPVDVIKIDKALVGRLIADATGAAVIGGLLHTAEKLGITVVAEGVENEVQAAQLSRLGCCLAQGYLFSKPLARDSITSLLAASRDGNVRSLPNSRR